MSHSSYLFETDEDILDFRVELERVHAELPTDAAALVPAEGGLLMDAPAAVDAQHPGLIGERDDGQHRAEDLFLGDPHSVIGAIEHGRLQVAAPRQRAAGSRT